MAALETSLQRLSTGLRINSGKDDPAGLIASEMLRSEIAGVKQAISNTQQANNMIAVADSALNEVSNLLVSIRGLVTEAANTAVMSDEMLAANQLQVDATLNAIDRISSSTTFMGRQLLDGSLNFVTEGVDRTAIKNLQVNEAQFGLNDHIDVAVSVRNVAEKAELFYDHGAAMEDIILTWKGNMGAGVESFAKGTSITEIAGVVNATSDATGVRAIVHTDATYGRMIVSSVGPDNDIIITSNVAGKDGGFVEVKFTKGSDRGIYVDYQESLGSGYPATINVQLQTQEWKSAEAKGVVTANPNGIDQNSALDFVSNIPGDKYNDTTINIVDGNLTDAYFADPDRNPTGTARGVYAEYHEDAMAATAVMGNVNGLTEFDNMGGFIALTAASKGSAYNNVNIRFVQDNDGAQRGDDPASAKYDEDSKTLNIYVKVDKDGVVGDTSSFEDIINAINKEETFKAALVGGDSSALITANDIADVKGNTNNSGGDAGTLYIRATTNESPTAASSATATGFSGDQEMTFTAKTASGRTDVVVQTVDDPTALGIAGAVTNAAVDYDAATGKITVYIKAGATNTDIENAFTGSNAAEFFDLATSGSDAYTAGDGGTIVAGAGSINIESNNPKSNGANVVMAKDTTLDGTGGARAVYDESTKTLTIYVADDDSTSLDAINTAISNDVSRYFTSSVTGDDTETVDDAVIGNATGVKTGPLTSVQSVHTAQDIVNAFNSDLPESIGSERAADMFTVTKSIDNDGTGHLYAQVFKNVFKDGITGGDVISTAQEVVAALNHSEYWGTVMTSEQLAEWIAKANDPVDPCDTVEGREPIIWAMIAPGDHGLNTVTAFDEVAYYGDPYSGNGLQFLGPEGSKPIRFVATPGNSQLSVDFTTFADELDYSQAILNGVNPNSQIVITANQKGDQNDDVLFQIVRVKEDPNAVPPLIRDSGWVTYDEGESFAQAHVILNDNATGTAVSNTAFTVTSNDRGSEYNNVSVQMRQNAEQVEDVLVSFDTTRNALMVSLNSANLNNITTNDVLAAINAYQGTGIGNGSGSTFTAALSYGVPGNYNNDGTGTLASIGLTTQYMEVANTGTTGGHKGGTVTVYMVGEEDPMTGAYTAPTANQVIELINNDDIVGNKFTARSYITGAQGGTGTIDFIKDTNIVSDGGISKQGVMTVHLVTDENGIVQTTARDLVEFWDTLSYEQTNGVSVSLVREPGAEWDICDDTDGMGIVPPSPSNEECEIVSYEDVYFGAWSSDPESAVFQVPGYASGTMVAINGENASYALVSRRTGEEYNGYSLVYSNDPTLTGKYDDNVYHSNGVIEYNGIKLEVNENTKQITIYINEGQTTANDVKQLIESDPMTRLMFEVQLQGNGNGLVDVRDDTLLTKGGTVPASTLNGAKLLGGLDGSAIGLTFVSTDYGSNQFVDVQSSTGAFDLKDKNGKIVDRSYGEDADVLINGVKAVSKGLNVSLNTATLALQFTLDENTQAGYSNNFMITGGGATFQIGPRVVSNQQITIGIPSINSAELGGSTGRLYELRDGNTASLANDPTRAYQIIEEAIVRVTEIRGRLGTLQAVTFEPNVSVLQDTLEALSTAESQIRDTDFAEETSTMTRNQVLVQSSMNSLSVANQMPNYILSLLRQ